MEGIDRMVRDLWRACLAIQNRRLPGFSQYQEHTNAKSNLEEIIPNAIKRLQTEKQL
jgi:hypothetical protein